MHVDPYVDSRISNKVCGNGAALVAAAASGMNGDRRRDKARYRELLWNAAGAGKAEVDELRRLIAALGKTSEDAKRDMEAVDRFRAATALANSAASAEKKMASATATLKEFHAKMTAEIKALEAEHMRLTLASRGAYDEFAAAQAAAAVVARMRDESPDLLDMESVPMAAA